MPYLYIDVAYQYIDGVCYSDVRFWVILDAVLTGDRIFYFHFSPVENDGTMKLPFIRACLISGGGGCGGCYRLFLINQGGGCRLFLCFIGSKKEKQKNRFL